MNKIAKFAYLLFVKYMCYLEYRWPKGPTLNPFSWLSGFGGFLLLIILMPVLLFSKEVEETVPSVPQTTYIDLRYINWQREGF